MNSFEKSIDIGIKKINEKLTKSKHEKNKNINNDTSISKGQEKPILVNGKSLSSSSNEELTKLKPIPNPKNSWVGYVGYNKINYNSKKMSFSEQEQKLKSLSYIKTIHRELLPTQPIFEMLVKHKLKPNDVLIVTNMDICSNSLLDFLKLQTTLFQKSIILISLDFLYSEHEDICKLIEAKTNKLDQLRFFHPFSKSDGSRKNQFVIDNNLFSLFLHHAGDSAQRQKDLRQAQLQIAYIILYYCSIRQISEIRRFTKKDIEQIISNGFGDLGKSKTKGAKQSFRLLDHCEPNVLDKIIEYIRINFQIIFKDYEYQFLFGKERPITDKSFIKIVNEDLKATSKKYFLPCIVTSVNFQDSITIDLSNFLQKKNTKIISEENYYTSSSIHARKAYYNPDTNQVGVIERIDALSSMLFKLPTLEMDSIKSNKEVYNRERHSELLKLRKSRVLTDEEELELATYFNMLNGRIRWETKEAYLEMTNTFLKEQINFDLFLNSFKQRHDFNISILRNDILNDFENKRFILYPDEKSNQFSDYITKIDMKIQILKDAYSARTLFMSDTFKSQSDLSINEAMSALKEILIEFLQEYEKYY